MKTTKQIVEKLFSKTKITWIDESNEKGLFDKWYSEKELNKALNRRKKKYNG